MKYQDILAEAPEYGVTVRATTDSTHFWAGGEQRAFMYRASGSWLGVSEDATGEKIRYQGQKARVASWCLDNAANGPQ